MTSGYSLTMAALPLWGMTRMVKRLTAHRSRRSPVRVRLEALPLVARTPVLSNSWMVAPAEAVMFSVSVPEKLPS